MVGFHKRIEQRLQALRSFRDLRCRHIFRDLRGCLHGDQNAVNVGLLKYPIQMRLRGGEAVKVLGQVAETPGVGKADERDAAEPGERLCGQCGDLSGLADGEDSRIPAAWSK